MMRIGEMEKLGPMMKKNLMEKLGFGKKINCVDDEIRVQDGNKVTRKVLLREIFLCKSRSPRSFDRN